jgi:pimeloyl-ACP methyl ester carboxylesterase
MDAAGMEQAAVMGLSEGGSLGALFAATYPNRCAALILCGAFARFSSWFPTEEAFAQFLGYVDQAWGSGDAVPFFIPSRVPRSSAGLVVSSGSVQPQQPPLHTCECQEQTPALQQNR